MKSLHLAPLENGDHLNQSEFHRRYEGMSKDLRAELIGGIVFKGGRRTATQGRCHVRLISLLTHYEDATSGIEALGPVTTILGPLSETEPDACLIVRPDRGGQTWEDADGYMNGAPEWVGEICSGPDSIELHRKKIDYERFGVREYVVAAVRTQEVYRFVRRAGLLERVSYDPDGIFRSPIFPGLWLDPVALLTNDNKRLLVVLRRGLASPEHAAFVAKLAAKKS